MIRVMIVDAEAKVRQGLQMRLAIEPDMTVASVAGKVEEALARAEELKPDVVVVDIGMRDAEGVNLIGRLRMAAPGAAVVVLTLQDDGDTRARALEAGAGAFLEKHGGAADLVEAIRTVASVRS